MSWMPNGQDVERAFKKLTDLGKDPDNGLKLRDSSEKYGYYWIDGVRQFYVSSKARKSGGVGHGRLIQLRKYLQLNTDQFKELCICQMTGPQYDTLIREILGLQPATGEPSG